VTKTVPYLSLFRYAQTPDKCMIVAGVICAVAHGVLTPMSAIIFGNVIDSFSSMPLEHMLPGQFQPNCASIHYNRAFHASLRAFFPAATPTVGGDLDPLVQKVSDGAIWFLYLGIVAAFTSYFQVRICK
jgi:hypothetical protein